MLEINYYDKNFKSDYYFNINQFIYYYKNELFSGRDGLPAIEHNDKAKEWYKEGKLHREDGPAVEYSNGNKSWYYNNERVYCKDNEEFKKLINLLAFK